MKIDEALTQFSKIKLPEWDGYLEVNKVELEGRTRYWVKGSKLAPYLDESKLNDNRWGPAYAENCIELRENMRFSFGQAIEYLKEGRLVCREGWNEMGMFLVLTPGSEIAAENMKVKAVRDQYMDNHQAKTVKIAPHIDMRAADGAYITGWMPSQADMLANDWMLCL